jgi:hypothetical protein
MVRFLPEALCLAVCMLMCRLSLWWCAVLMVCGQVPAFAQLFLLSQRPATNATSAVVPLGWNPSPDTNVTGYWLCWGLSNDACTNRLDVGESTSGTVAGLAPDVIYYFTVVAYDNAGDEAPPSNMVMYPPGPTLKIRPASGGMASGVSLSFQGNTGLVCSLQATLDFTNWTTLLTTNCSAAGLVVFPVSDLASYSRRFYRLLVE